MNSRRPKPVTERAQAAEALSGIDVLVNNAGIAGPTKPVQDVEPDEWESVLRVDLTGTFNVTRNGIPHRIKSDQGAIINMASAAGRFGYPNRSPYATVKWGLIGFTKTLSMELGEHNIRVNAIAPGTVEGPRIQRVFEGRAQATGQSLDDVKRLALANQSIKHLVGTADIAALAVFLVSDAAKSISGQCSQSTSTCNVTEGRFSWWQVSPSFRRTQSMLSATLQIAPRPIERIECNW